MKTMKVMFPALALGALFAGNAQADLDCIVSGSVWGLSPVIDDATDDGAGRIKVEWSLEPDSICAPAENTTPEEACVAWDLESGEGETSHQCYTDEAGSQNDLVFDSGMADDVASATYRVRLAGQL